MRDAVIVEAIRTPIGLRDGVLSTMHPVDLSAHLLEVILQRTGIDPDVIEEVVWGCASQVGEQASNIARNAVLAAGWPEAVAAMTVNRQSGSSQQSIHIAAAGLVAGHYDVVVAGGVESISRVPRDTPTLGNGPFGELIAARYGKEVPHPGVVAELIALRWGLSRAQLDDFAAGSHESAAAARLQRRFDQQIAPVTLPNGVSVEEDEGIRADAPVDELAGLPTMFMPAQDGGVITAGNSAQASDGAAALLLMTSRMAFEVGLTPIARVHTAVAAGSDPETMTPALVHATRKALRRGRLTIDGIGVFEVNESYAPIPLTWLAEMGADPKALNPNGGAIAVGHPLGGAGARLMTTLVHHMRDNDVRYGLQTMATEDGQATTTILELLS